MTKKRIFGLDVVRAIAIVLVLFAHSVTSQIYGIKLGALGVEIFFVLSGFLIGRILIKEFMVPISRETLTRFWIRRWFRTLPLYYIILMFRYILIDDSIGLNIFYYFFFLQNNFYGVDFLPISWSLVIEEWFYFSLPVLILLFFKKGIRGKENLFILFLIGIILAENLFRWWWVGYADRPWGGIIGNFPFRLDSMVAGVLIAAVKLFKQNWYAKLSGRLSFILSFSSMIALLYIFGQANLNKEIDQLVWTRTIWFFALSFLVALQLPFIEKYVDFNIKLLNPFKKGITWVSETSYSMYLVHVFVFGHYFDNYYINLVAKWGLLFVVVHFTYKYIELPIMKLRDKKSVLKLSKA